MLESSEHSSKAKSPILVTESGISMLVSDVHWEKADLPILVTESGISSQSQILCKQEIVQ